MALTVKIRGDATHLEKTLASAKKGVSGLASGMLKFGAAGAGFAAMLAGLNGVEAVVTKLGGFLKDASMESSNIESLSMQFETLLGSADAAQKRMEDLVKFAASTPFEVKELSQTSKLLQTLGGTMLATGEGLRMVGDAAAIAGQPLGEVGLHIGRIFNAITSGTSAGESIARMQELGLMSGVVKRRFEELAEAQKKGTAQVLTSDQALKLLKETFMSTEGAMARLAATTEGKLSNMKDNVTALKVALGTGINDGLRDALDAANNTLPLLQERFKLFGQDIGGAIKDAVNGNYDIILQAGVIIGKALKEGFLMAVGDLSNSIFNQGTEGVPKSLFEDALGQLGFERKPIAGTPQRTPQQFAEDLKYVTAGERKAFNETVSQRNQDRMLEELIRNRQATERLIEKGIKITRENLAQELHSR